MTSLVERLRHKVALFFGYKSVATMLDDPHMDVVLAQDETWLAADALEAAEAKLAQAQERMRERCAKVCENLFWYPDDNPAYDKCATAIRALPIEE